MALDCGLRVHLRRAPFVAASCPPMPALACMRHARRIAGVALPVPFHVPLPCNGNGACVLDLLRLLRGPLARGAPSALRRWTSRRPPESSAGSCLRAPERRAATHSHCQVDIGNRLSGISCSALPLSSFSTRLVSYWGVAQGFRSLLAVMSCELLASSAYIFMGALGAAASSWLAIRSAGLETEKQIRQCIGEEVAKLLRERAKETSETVADITMQPCKEAVDRFEDSFSLRLEEHRQAIDRVVALLSDGGPALEARRTRCEEFLAVLAKEQKKLIDAQGDLLRRATTATAR